MESTLGRSCRRSPDEVCLQPLESRTKPGSRRSRGGVFLQSKLKAKSGSHRSPDESYRRLTLAMEPGSRRSPSGVYLRLKLLAMKSGSRRSPGGPPGADPAEDFGCGYFIPNTKPDSRRSPGGVFL